MRARITLVGSDVFCWSESGEGRIPCTQETLAALHGWAKRYEAIVRAGDPGPLLLLGRELFAWLDPGTWASAWARGPGERVLEVAVEDPNAEWAEALLDVPWEVLADASDFLASDPAQPFVVFRSVARAAEAKPAKPPHQDLAMIFMAAAPPGASELDYEAEESGILEATAQLPLQLWVEESGCAQFLEQRLAQEGPFEAVHLSCHGGIGKDGPRLALESPEGDLDLATPGQLAEALGENKPVLLVLSACRTAEPTVGTPGRSADSFARSLVRTGVPNVLGWDGSVYDRDANSFSRSLYEQVAERRTLPYAVAIARRDLLREHREDADRGRHWHLARLYAGPLGAGALCAAGATKRKLRRDAGYKEFLDPAHRKVPVATAAEFVGRRRQAQRILRCFREGKKAGVLVFGMASLGKSSLAARVANRMPRHETVVVFERYDAVAVFDRLVEALPAADRDSWREGWRERVRAKPPALADALEAMLEGPFHERPILLVVDDLERILAPHADREVTPVADTPGAPDAWRQSLGAVLRAFAKAESESRLLLTSRYRFALPDDTGRDLADLLEPVPLPPMERPERAKQWRAAQRVAGGEKTDLVEVEPLFERILSVAAGNPGLQQVLCRPLLAGDAAVAEAAVGAVQRWLETGEVPQEESAAQEFFRRVSFETYAQALDESQRRQLWAATVFSEDVPVPVSALTAVGHAASVQHAEAAIRRLLGLGLFDDWGELDGRPHAAASALARPLGIEDGDPIRLAGAAVEALSEAWRNADGDFHHDWRAVEAARLAVVGEAPAAIVAAAASAAGFYLFRRQHNAHAALAIVEAAIATLDKEGAEPPANLLRLAAECAGRLGKAGDRLAFLQRGLALPGLDPVSRAELDYERAGAAIEAGDPERALDLLRAAAAAFAIAGEERSRAVTLGSIADVLQQRGETDEALRIRREEELPVFERLGEVRERAVTIGKIADILAQRGETDEALRIRREEELPVFERLGEVREHAVTVGKIADILQQRGETDEALRIRREEQLPVFERLGEVRDRAVTVGKIADILQQRGDTDEALRIRREEELPVFERLGDVRARAVTMSKIADVLEQRGETDEALRIRREEQLPVFERLGDVRERAVTIGKIADILQRRGDTDEALRIRRDEQLPVFERLGDVRARAVAMGKIADILQQRGDTDEALRIHLEERLPIAQRLADMDEVAHTRFRCAQIRISRGGVDSGEAETILGELAESFAINLKLRRADGIAVVGLSLGELMVARGQTKGSLAILDQAAVAAEKIGMAKALEQIRGLQDIIRSRL